MVNVSSIHNLALYVFLVVLEEFSNHIFEIFSRFGVLAAVVLSCKVCLRYLKLRLFFFSNHNWGQSNRGFHLQV